MVGKGSVLFYPREEMRGDGEDVVAINQCEDVLNVTRLPEAGGLDTAGRNGTNSSIAFLIKRGLTPSYRIPWKPAYGWLLNVNTIGHFSLPRG